MAASAFSTSDEVITRTINCHSVATSKDVLTEVYEIERCVYWIQQNTFKRIALQFPDALLVDAPSVATELQIAVQGTNVFILGDTSFGSCCVDEVGAQHYKAECVIHFGSACLSPTTRLPVLYVFGRASIDPSDCVVKVQEVLTRDTNVVLMYNTIYSYAADNLYTKLKPHFKELILSELLDPSDILSLKTSTTTPLSMPDLRDALDLHETHKSCNHGVALCKCGRRILLPFNSKLEDYTFLYVGSSDCPALVSMMMTFNKNIFFTYDPKEAACVKESVSINRALMKRYYLVERAKDANIVGIVAGTLGVAKYKNMIDHLKSLLKNVGKKSYTFVVGKLNPAKLANFAEVDLYVLVACPESCLLDQTEFYRPVVSPLEIEMACNQAREWTGDYSTDFRDLLPGGSMYIQSTPFKDSEVTDVSLINNKMRTLGVAESTNTGEESQQSVAIKSDSTVANYAQNAGEFLAGRRDRKAHV